MYEIEKKQIEEIKEKFEHLLDRLNITEKSERLKQLDELTQAAELWNNPQTARELLQEQQNVKRLLEETQDLKNTIESLLGLIELAQSERDASLETELQSELKETTKIYDEYEFHLTLNGELDHSNAYLIIHSGAGGTEACDWVSMLLRMYTRWCERHKFKYKVIDSLDGDEAGYKSVTLNITGEYVYGNLKAERGVHRLVRISPFDSNKRRHTSFASVDAMAEIDDNIDIEISESDLRIDTYRASGAGGQHVNTTDSAVRITHIPTGVMVACQNERSQIKNRSTAMKMLKGRLYEMELEKRQKEASNEYSSKQKIEWGSQIRSYVLHPYNMVKDLRTDCETSNTSAVLDGEIDEFIETYLRHVAKTD